MSLYNVMHSCDENANLFLDWIGLTVEDFGRFRDAYLNKDGTEITVFARIGKNSWCANQDEVLKRVTSNKYFVHEFDDSYDDTYKHLIYTVPEEYMIQARTIAPSEEPLSLKDKTEKDLAEMSTLTREELRKHPRYGKLAKMLDQMMEGKGPEDGIFTI